MDDVLNTGILTRCSTVVLKALLCLMDKVLLNAIAEVSGVAF